MRRIGVLLIVVATAIAVALPAGAKKPPRPDDPPPPPTYYRAEITAVPTGIPTGIPAGIATDCTTPLVLRRNDIHFEWFSDGADPEDDDPILRENMELKLTAPGLVPDEIPLDPGETCFDAGTMEGTDGDGLPTTVIGPGYFRITLEDDGTVGMLWIFETRKYVEEVPFANGKRTKLVSGRTDYRMGGPYDGNDFATADSVEIKDETITIDILNADPIPDGDPIAYGYPFHFVRYDSEADPMFTDFTSSIQNFALVITLTPCDSVATCTGL